MTKENSNSQNPGEMAKAAQEAAVKAAMEQAQAMFGNIPGFQMPGGMQEQIMAQMGAGMPDMAAAQAQQEAMLKAAGIDPETVVQAGRQNMAYANQMMQEMMDGAFDEGLSSSDAMAQMMEAFGDDSWTINRAEDGKLDEEQLRLLAFGAPMLVYNDEKWIRLTVMQMSRLSNTHLRIGGMLRTGIVHWVSSDGCWKMGIMPKQTKLWQKSAHADLRTFLRKNGLMRIVKWEMYV